MQTRVYQLINIQGQGLDVGLLSLQGDHFCFEPLYFSSAPHTYEKFHLVLKKIFRNYAIQH